MATQYGSWSLRQAAADAGVTRALARSCAQGDLVPATGLTLADLVVLRCEALVRTAVFPGETRPANTAKDAPWPREVDAAALVRAVPTDGTAVDASLLVFADRAELALDTRALITATMAAQAAGLPYLVLPIGAWFTELSTPAVRGGELTRV